MIMMKLRRTQIYLDEKDMRQLKKEGKRQGCSVSSVIRDAVRNYLNKKEGCVAWQDDPVTKLIGKFKAGETDLSENIDKELYEG